MRQAVRIAAGPDESPLLPVVRLHGGAAEGGDEPHALARPGDRAQAQAVARAPLLDLRAAVRRPIGDDTDVLARMHEAPVRPRPRPAPAGALRAAHPEAIRSGALAAAIYGIDDGDSRDAIRMHVFRLRGLYGSDGLVIETSGAGYTLARDLDERAEAALNATACPLTENRGQ
jgi:hypothetical protein